MTILRRKLNTMLHTPRIFMKKFAHSPLFGLLPDELALKIQFKNVFLRDLDLKDPKTFNEKLQWLKLYDRKPEYTTMVDKYAAKQYAAAIIGDEHIIPTLGVWDRFEDIDFDDLPDQFVLKCTHGSGDVVICKDKSSFDREAARKKITKALRTDYYKISREWPYKDVQRKVLAERYMEDDMLGELRDYKFFCFNGRVKCFKVDFDRFINHRANYYDREGVLLPFGEVSFPPDPERRIFLPPGLEMMIAFAESLSASIPFLRVDFYYVNGNIYFGESTFYPAAGFGVFTLEEWDRKMGEWLELPV